MNLNDLKYNEDLLSGIKLSTALSKNWCRFDFHILFIGFGVRIWHITKVWEKYIDVLKPEAEDGEFGFVKPRLHWCRNHVFPKFLDNSI